MKENQILLALDSADPRRTTPVHPRPRILLVDDDRSMRELNEEVLRDSGYEVDSAADGAAGWAALQAKSYDLLITDNSMPKVSGIELVRLLRGRDTNLPVIMASGAVPSEELMRTHQLAINAILLKPHTLGELLATVRKLLHAPPDPAA